MARDYLRSRGRRLEEKNWSVFMVFVDILVVKDPLKDKQHTPRTRFRYDVIGLCRCVDKIQCVPCTKNETHFLRYIIKTVSGKCTVHV